LHLLNANNNSKNQQKQDEESHLEKYFGKLLEDDEINRLE
jgi:hypothetical protein